MASAARALTRAFARATPSTSSARSSVTRSTARFSAPVYTFRASSRRGYSSSTEGGKSSSGLVWGLAAVAAGGAGAYYYLTGDHLSNSAKTAVVTNPTKEDFQKVYDEVAKLLVEHDDYDDGSYGPVSYYTG